MNSIEEKDNLIQLMQEALKFYADKTNYAGYMGNPSSIDLDEHGSQARFALERVKQLTDANQKMQEDYDRFMAGYEMLQASEEVADPQELIKAFGIGYTSEEQKHLDEMKNNLSKFEENNDKNV